MSCRGLNRVVKEEEEDGKDSGLDFGEGMGSCLAVEAVYCVE